MKKNNIFKIAWICIIVFFFMFGCSNTKTKVISNIDNETEKVTINEQKKENEEESETNVKEEEGIIYKGYKGPVQGEKKYQEGTPATENSHEYKASGDIESPYHVDLIVTRDFGYQKMFCKTVGLVKDEVGMEVLFRNLDIQTAYGGGFVNAINGLESQYTFFTGEERKKLDWFYWINGILGPVGVAEYRPQPGDVIWWDYHNWGTTMFIPAVIGSYPQPFKNGFWGKNPGTVIMYASDEYINAAEQLKQSLLDKEVKQIDIGPFDPSVLEKPKKYYILLGVWEDFAEKCDLIKELNKKNKFQGIYANFNENGKVEALNFKGKVVTTHEQAGVIYAFSSGIGALKPVWMVSGTDDEGVKMAIELLLNDPQAIDKCFGVVISKDGVENVPYFD